MNVPHQQLELQLPPTPNTIQTTTNTRPLVLLKVKRKVSDIANPNIVHLHRIIEQFEVYPDEISEAEYQRQRRFQMQLHNTSSQQANQAKRQQDDELVSLFGNVKIDSHGNSIVVPQTASQQEQLSPSTTSSIIPSISSRFPSSGYVPANPTHDLNDSTDRQSPFGNIADFRSAPGYDLKSKTVFKKVGVATTNDISSLNLQDWYMSLSPGTGDQSGTDGKNNAKNKNIALFEVQTLNSAKERITTGPDGASDDQSDSKDSINKSDSILHRLHQMYGNSVQMLINMKPLEDINYSPKPEQQLQLAQTIAPLAKGIKGLKAPPPRRGAVAVTSKKTTCNNNQNSHFRQISNYGGTSALLDDDTIQYIHQQTMLAQHENGAHAQQPLVDKNNNGNSVDGTGDDDMYDMYDIYEVCSDLYPDVAENTSQNTNPTPPDEMLVVIPRSELDYVIAVNQVDQHMLRSTLENGGNPRVDKSGHFLSLHDEFQSQFTKPRLHFHQRLLHHISQSQIGYCGNGRGSRGGPIAKHFGNHDHEDHVEAFERGYYDDDHHPDFDSDMDYPDSDDGENDYSSSNNGGIGQNRCVKFDDDKDGAPFIQHHTVLGRPRQFNQFQYNGDGDGDDDEDDNGDDGSYGGDYDCDDDDDQDGCYLGGRYDDDDDDYNGNGLFDETTNNANDSDCSEDDNGEFRYGGVKTGSRYDGNHGSTNNAFAHFNLNRNELPITMNLSIEDLDTQDPLTRELALHAYKMNFRANQRILDLSDATGDRLAGQNGEFGKIQKFPPPQLSPSHPIPPLTTTTDNDDQNGNKVGAGMNDNTEDVDKINRDVFNLLFGDSDDEDSDSDSDGGYTSRPKKNKNRGSYHGASMDDEDPYGGTNTFRQFQRNEVVYDEFERE